MKRILSIVLTLALLLTALPLALSVSAAETVWTLVTDVNELNAGDKVVIVAKDYDYALSTNQKSNNRGATAVTKNGDTVTINNDVQILTLEKDNVTGKFAFHTGTGYLCAASSSSNYLRTETTLSDNSSWSITVDANGVATIKSQGTYTRNWMRYNDSSTLFACYSSGQKDICLYVGTETGGNEPTCEHTGETTYGKTDSEHWLICDDCSKEIANSRKEHDFSNGDCVCGQEAPYVPDIEGSSLTFELAADGEAKHSDGGNDINGSQDFKDTTGTYTLTINNATKVYPNARDEKGNGCLKLGGSSSAASLSFTVPDNVVKVIFSVAQYKANTTKISINGGAAQTITTASNNGAYTPVEFDTTTTKSITLSTVSGGYRAMLNSITFLTANAEEECTHENTTKTDANVVGATYFVDGSKDIVCECGETVQTGVVIPATAKALSSCEEEFANGNLTITLTYSEALIKDIQNGAVISFNYSIGEYSNSIEIPTGIAAVVTLEGFNTDRLNAELTYYLTAKYTGVNTDKLAGDTTNSLKVSEKLDANSEIGVLMNALKTEANTVVSTKIDATTHFAENTITADLKEGTMVLNFIASDELVTKLGENSGLARTNKITVTIDGVANEYKFTPAVMRKSTTINISGMSFEQLNGTVTVKVEFIYNNANVEDITDTITFEGAKAVEATDSAVATAFKNYIAK